MMGKTHLAIGVLLLFVLARFTDMISGNEISATVLILLASVLPDIDTARSMVGRKFKVIGWVFRHRGFFHSIFAMVTFGVIVFLLFQSQELSIVFMSGYASHLIADSMTREGTMLFYPRKHKVKGPLKVGSFAETLVFLLLVALSVWLIF